MSGEVGLSKVVVSKKSSGCIAHRERLWKTGDTKCMELEIAPLTHWDPQKTAPSVKEDLRGGKKSDHLLRENKEVCFCLRSRWGKKKVSPENLKTPTVSSRGLESKYIQYMHAIVKPKLNS